MGPFLIQFPLGSMASTVLYAFTTSDIFCKTIVVILLAGSVFAWSIMLTKRREFRAVRLNDRAFLTAYRRESHPLALYMQAERAWQGPLAAMYKETCRTLLEDKGIRPGGGTDLFAGRMEDGRGVRLTAYEVNSARRITERAAMDLGFYLEEDMGLLATAVTGAPFLGLLGTVWGVMDAFKSMAGSGTVMLSEVAPGISGALLTTVIGLLVALPSLIGYNLLTNQVRRLSIEIENFGEEMTHDIERFYVRPE